MSPPCSAPCASRASTERERAIALIVARILAPGSKLATARGLAADTARDSLAEMLGIETVDEDQLYAAMDWLLERQCTIEQRLAQRPSQRRRKLSSAFIVWLKLKLSLQIFRRQR